MIKKILLVLALALVAILVVAVFRPDTMHVARSATIAAPPSAVFAVVNDFRRWDDWSPWSKLDPEMKVNFEGPPIGVGAVYKWSGNNEVGEGSTTLVESVPDEKVGMKLAFVRPFPGESDVQFTFAPEGAGTKVTWEMSGHNSFAGKVIGLVMNCEKMVARQYDQGLSNLKAVAERPDGAATSA